MKVYKNPLTGEIVEAKGGNYKLLKPWKGQFGQEIDLCWLSDRLRWRRAPGWRLLANPRHSHHHVHVLGLSGSCSWMSPFRQSSLGVVRMQACSQD